MNIANLRMTVFISVIIMMNVYSEAYQMTREELIEKLKEHKFPDEKMDDWICLVEHESSRKTHVVGKVNKNGSRDYGMFQINDNYWCSNTTVPGKDCHVTCNDLIADDITKAANCAKKIYRRQGFLAWHGWEKHCQNLHKEDAA